MSSRSLVVKVTAGKDDPERCNQAFTVAATAAASGVPVSLWLTGEAAWFALPGRGAEVELPHAMPLADLLSGVLAAGTVTVCTQCAARRGRARWGRVHWDWADSGWVRCRARRAGRRRWRAQCSRLTSPGAGPAEGGHGQDGGQASQGREARDEDDTTDHC